MKWSKGIERERSEIQIPPLANTNMKDKQIPRNTKDNKTMHLQD